MMAKLKPLLGVLNTRRGDKASLGSSLPVGKLALTMLTDALSSGLLRATGLAGSVQPHTTRKAPSILHPAVLPAALLASGGLSPQLPFCTPLPAGQRQPLGRPFLQPGVPSACCCLKLSPLQRRDGGRGHRAHSVSLLGTWMLVLKSTPHLTPLHPQKCPHRAGCEPRPPARVRCGWNP